MGGVTTESALACPHCGFVRTESMPTDACVQIYVCSSCEATLRPKAGDCCVFCSYGSRECPPKQRGNAHGAVS